MKNSVNFSGSINTSFCFVLQNICFLVELCILRKLRNFLRMLFSRAFLHIKEMCLFGGALFFIQCIQQQKEENIRIVEFLKVGFI